MQLNRIVRLALIAKDHDPEFLNDAESFDRVLGGGRFAELSESDGLGHVRRLVEALNDRASNGRNSSQLATLAIIMLSARFSASSPRMRCSMSVIFR
jgi:hypothetical protein